MWPGTDQALPEFDQLKRSKADWKFLSVSRFSIPGFRLFRFSFHLSSEIDSARLVRFCRD